MLNKIFKIFMYYVFIVSHYFLWLNIGTLYLSNEYVLNYNFFIGNLILYVFIIYLNLVYEDLKPVFEMVWFLFKCKLSMVLIDCIVFLRLGFRGLISKISTNTISEIIIKPH